MSTTDEREIRTAIADTEILLDGIRSNPRPFWRFYDGPAELGCMLRLAQLHRNLNVVRVLSEAPR